MAEISADGLHAVTNPHPAVLDPLTFRFQFALKLSAHTCESEFIVSVFWEAAVWRRVQVFFYWLPRFILKYRKKQVKMFLIHVLENKASTLQLYIELNGTLCRRWCSFKWHLESLSGQLWELKTYKAAASTHYGDETGSYMTLCSRQNPTAEFQCAYKHCTWVNKNSMTNHKKRKKEEGFCCLARLKGQTHTWQHTLLMTHPLTTPFSR